ncbi:septal ring lytic transglycosylase RlpA family protein [Marinilabilia sp.]|uniref:septal ring lytic transglycosylase RlpA family protein n=1 Tax=Marinilabilia sp. TaxID=2021252 RepID=UPI0025C5185E|nr:septal ring lytic transglycosylase RlpA family protein [Marinilabilia sp.]
MKKHILTLMLVFSLISGLCAQNNTTTGLASYYADKFEGRQTASGEIYSHSKLTAAHPSLPFGTMLKVTNLRNSKTVFVRVNDRGPFVKGRIVDLSKSAAIQLDAVKDGLIKVKIEQTSEKQPKELPHLPVKEYFQIDVHSKTLSGYGVQIGSFSQIDNLIRLSDKVKKEIPGNIYVLVANVKGKTVNRLIVGVEATKEKAGKHLKRLQKVFPDCFIIQL